MAESMAAVYPTFTGGVSTTAAADPSHRPRTTPADGPSAHVGSTIQSPDVSQQQEQEQNSPPAAPYSPTRAELESHPIRQRLSEHCDYDDDEDDESTHWSELATATEGRDLVGGEELLFSEDNDENSSRFLENGDMTDTEIKQGDAAAYSWGGDKKGGTVVEVAKEGSVTMDTARGNTVEKEAKPGDPAVRLEREGHDVVKNASELSKESKGESHNEGGVHKTIDENGQVEKKHNDGEEKKEEEKVVEKENGEKKHTEKKANGEANIGEKRTAEDELPKENGDDSKKKKGRPAKNAIEGVKKEVKKRMPKKAATESGEPRRSGRNASKSS